MNPIIELEVSDGRITGVRSIENNRDGYRPSQVLSTSVYTWGNHPAKPGFIAVGVKMDGKSGWIVDIENFAILAPGEGYIDGKTFAIVELEKGWTERLGPEIQWDDPGLAKCDALVEDR